jgi:ribosomal protein S27E
MVDAGLAGGRSAARGSRFLLVAPRSSYPRTVSVHLATCPNCKGEMDVTDVGPYTRVRCPGCGEEVWCLSREIPPLIGKLRSRC